ncbi:hypothetical protein ACGFX4_38480 [Kitasatospora sp. NPDC048365]
MTAVERDLSLIEIGHSPQCPTYTIERILREASAERVNEQDA